jgi:pimeloyl-ACP methyl ester carboxylesterase
MAEFNPKTDARTVIVHPYPSPTSNTSNLYEYPSSSSPSQKENALVLIPGLGDSPHGIPYTYPLASHLSSTSWSVFTAETRSAHTGWGSGSLSRDVDDLRAIVGFLRRKGTKKIVLMGHSTGCQDCVAYSSSLSSGDREGVDVDGYILQAGVSDREAFSLEMDSSTIKKITDWAETKIKEGKGEDEVVPRSWLPEGMFTDGFVSAYRWYSLASVGYVSLFLSTNKN